MSSRVLKLCLKFLVMAWFVACCPAVLSAQEDTPAVTENHEVEQLTKQLKELENWRAGNGAMEGVKANQRRVEVATQMLELEKQLTDEQRKLAITAKLNALTTLYGYGLLLGDTIPDVTESLTSTSKTYSDSPDQEIKKLARLSLYKVTAFEMTKDKNKPDAQEVEVLVEDTSQLLNDFSDDTLVLATVDMIVEYYRQDVDRKVALEITEGLVAKKEAFKSPKVLRLLADLSDEALMAKSKYTQLFENRWINGDEGQRDLLEASIQLAAEPDAGMLLVQKVDAVAHWFEQDDQYVNAVAIYETILKSADTYQNRETTVAAKKRAEDGIMRSKLIREKIDLSGRLIDGKEFSEKELQGKVVLVVFWSALNPISKKVVEKLSKSSKHSQERGIQILAVNIDPKLDKEAIQEVTKKAPGVTFLFGNTDGKYSNNILNQCPSETVPRIMLVNQDGEVADINVPLDEVSTQLDLLIGQ